MSFLYSYFPLHCPLCLYLSPSLSLSLSSLGNLTHYFPPLSFSFFFFFPVYFSSQAGQLPKQWSPLSIPLAETFSRFGASIGYVFNNMLTQPLDRYVVEIVFCTALYSTVRSCVVLCCVVLCFVCILQYCSVLHFVVLYCIVLYCMVQYCIVWCSIVLYYMELYYIVVYCVILLSLCLCLFLYRLSSLDSPHFLILLSLLVTIPPYLHITPFHNITNYLNLCL